MVQLLLHSLYVNICSAVPASASRVWQQVHQQFHGTFFLMTKKKFQILGGEGLACVFVEGPRLDAEQQEHNTPTGSHHVAANRLNNGGGRERALPPRRKKNQPLSPSSSGVNGRTSDWPLPPLASTPLRVRGALAGGQGAGVHPRRETTPRREEGAGSLITLPAWKGAGGLATAPPD